MIADLHCTIGNEERIIRLSEEQILGLLKTAEVNLGLSGWEKSLESTNYFVNSLGNVQEIGDQSSVKVLYESANSFSSKLVATNVARADSLFRELRRFAILNRGEKIDPLIGGYTIMYNYRTNQFECGFTANWMAFGDVIFETEELARKAIDIYQEELLWYFTKMIDSL